MSASLETAAARTAPTIFSPPPELVGRERELRAIEGAIADARRGRSRRLVLEGEAGIGKTALLAGAAARASERGVTVVHTQGIESEGEMPFAGLFDLCRPLLPALAQIPEPQARALASAFALEPARPLDRFTVSAATLSLLSAAAMQAPVLVLVDDAHWLDTASADALLFATRRLELDPVATVLTVRTRAGHSLPTGHLEVLELGGIDLESSRRLLERAVGEEVPVDVVARLHAATGGNPLALLELPGTLSSAQLAGADPLDDPIRIGSRLEQAFAAQAAALGATARRALVVAAAETRGDLDTVVSAIRGLGEDPAVLDRAEDAGLVTRSGSVVRFGHPLVRSGVFHAAAPSERRLAHAALAAVLAGSRPLECAWHLAGSVSYPDDEAAAALESAARDAGQRAGFAAAAMALERAARLTPADGERARRLYLAGDYCWRAGRTARGDALLAEALELCEDARLRARIQHLRGHALLRRGAPVESHRLLVDEALRIVEVDPERAAFMLAEAGEAIGYLGEYPEVKRTVDRAAGLRVPRASKAAFMVAMVRGCCRMALGEREDGAALIGECVEIAAETPELRDDPAVLTWLINAHGYLDDLNAALAAASSAVETARRRGALGDLPYAGQYLASYQFWVGRWSEAYANAVEAAETAEESGQTGEIVCCQAVLAQIEAARGREPECRRHADRALKASTATGALHEWPAFALGLLELAFGRYEAAVDRLRPVVRLELGQAQHCPAMAPFDLVEALVRSGDRAGASAALAQIDAGCARRPWEIAGLARSQGLLGDGEQAQAAFEDAARRFAALSMPFERARTDLALGEWLRRHGERRAARARLRAALDTFETLGAEPWADRARRELRASGETVRRRDPSDLDRLTPQELQIALAVAEGRTNREVAAAFFLSPKTVEVHLTRAYRKLGIRSRTELARLVSERDLA